MQIELDHKYFCVDNIFILHNYVQKTNKIGFVSLNYLDNLFGSSECIIEIALTLFTYSIYINLFLRMFI